MNSIKLSAISGGNFFIELYQIDNLSFSVNDIIIVREGLYYPLKNSHPNVEKHKNAMIKVLTHFNLTSIVDGVRSFNSDVPEGIKKYLH